MVKSQFTEPVIELRVALTSADYERLVGFYRDGLGVQPAASWSNDGGRALMLNLGRATLELFDEAQAQAIDRIEAGARLSGRVRLALQVPDLGRALENCLAHGATLVHAPVQTPWGDHNARIQDPDGMQITLFQPPAAPARSAVKPRRKPVSSGRKKGKA